MKRIYDGFHPPHSTCYPKCRQCRAYFARCEVVNMRRHERQSVDLLKELRFARKTIRRMKRETNKFDEGRAIANKALKRIDAVLKLMDVP